MSLSHALGPRPPALAIALRDARAAARLAVAALRFILRRPALAGSTALALALAAASMAMSGEDEASAPVAAAPPSWIDVPRPLPMYALEAPEFARAPTAYAMRRKSDDSAREDFLTLGAFANGQAFLRLSVHRGAPEAGAGLLFVESARRAAESGLALDRLGQPVALKTRFGEGEFAEAKLSAGAGPREGCQAFSIAAQQPDVHITGLACGPDGLAFERRRLACLVGRLDLLGAGDDIALKNFFAEAELRRDPSCPSRARAGFAETSWVDQRHAAPALRAGQKR